MPNYPYGKQLPSRTYRVLESGEKWLYGFLVAVEMCAKALAVTAEISIKYALITLELVVKYVVLPLGAIWCLVWLVRFIF